MKMTDELATQISKGDVAVLQTSDLWACFDMIRKICAGVRVGQKAPLFVWVSVTLLSIDYNTLYHEYDL